MRSIPATGRAAGPPGLHAALHRAEPAPHRLTALGRAAGAADDLAEWRDAPERIVASLVAMDAAVGRLSGLNAFVAQQITLWNNQKR